MSRHFGLRCTREVFCRFLILNVFIIFRFLVLNAVEVSDQPFRVILKRVIRFMPPKASCCCPKHFRMCCTWRCSTCQLMREREQ